MRMIAKDHYRTQRRDIIAIGASAGGVEAISHLLKKFPPNFRGSVLVVLHRSPERISYLHNILSRATKLHVVIPDDGDPIKPNTCFISPPDQHLTIGPGLRVRLLPDAFYRSHNIDALFMSLAQHAGSRAIGVILSGQLKDGTLGLTAIKHAGGVSLVQSPSEAKYPEMPENAIKYDGAIDMVAPLDNLAEEIFHLVGHNNYARSDHSPTNPAKMSAFGPKRT